MFFFIGPLGKKENFFAVGIGAEILLSNVEIQWPESLLRRYFAKNHTDRLLFRISFRASTQSLKCMLCVCLIALLPLPDLFPPLFSRHPWLVKVKHLSYQHG